MRLMCFHYISKIYLHCGKFTTVQEVCPEGNIFYQVKEMADNSRRSLDQIYSLFQGII